MVQVSEDLGDDQRVVRLEITLQCPPQLRDLRAQLALGQFREQLGSRVPDRSACSIFRPETPSTSVATLESLIPASSSTLCSRLASRVRSWIGALR